MRIPWWLTERGRNEKLLEAHNGGIAACLGEVMAAMDKKIAEAYKAGVEDGAQKHARDAYNRGYENGWCGTGEQWDGQAEERAEACTDAAHVQYLG
jgi:hypothetical protein